MAALTASTLAAFSLAAGAVGTGVSVYGAVQSGRAQESAAKANAANLKATAQAQQAQAHEQRRRNNREVRRRLANSRATLASTGSVISSGSNKDVLYAQKSRLELAVEEDAHRQQQQIRATNQQAALQQWRGSQAATAGLLNATGSLIGGAASFAKSTHKFRDQGAL